MTDHTFFMDKALELAKKAYQENEVPVGAVIVKNKEIIAGSFNRREQNKNPLGHAELGVLLEASKKLNDWRFQDCTLYVTLEPCLMCVGALLESRMGELVYGTHDPKKGCVHSLYKMTEDPRFHHKMKVTKNIRSEECALLLKTFFKKIRKG